MIEGAVSLASNVVDAWKAHSDSIALSKAVNAPDFQQSMNAAATKAIAAAQQTQQAAMPGEIQSVTRQILLSPDVQSMARTGTSPTVSLQFNASGDLFATQAGGGSRRIQVSPEVRQQLQQLNGAMLHPATGKASGVAELTGEISSSHLPVAVQLAAI